MERLSTHVKRFIIPYIIVLAGLILLYTALFSGTGNISQSNDFLFGALSVLLLGVVIILILRNVIEKSYFKFIIPVMIVYCLFYWLSWTWGQKSLNINENCEKSLT